MGLQDETVFVTGAGQGLGRATAVHLSRLGMKVALNGRRRTRLEEVAGIIEAEGGKCLIAAGDISDDRQGAEGMQLTLKTFGSLEVLVNNAAVIGPPRSLDDADPAAWKQTMDINVNGAFYCCREALPVMIRQGRGRIINLISGLASMAYPRFCAYCASKAALLQMTRCLAEEFQDQPVQIMALDPGVMDTEMQAEIRSLDEEKLGHLQKDFLDLKKKDRLRSPQEVAEMIAALAERDRSKDSGRSFSVGDLIGVKTRDINPAGSDN